MNGALTSALTDGVISWYCVGDEPSSSELKEGLVVAVCTRGRSESLERFLVSLGAQRRLPDELLIVDASPDSTTESMVRDFQGLSRLAGSVRYARVSGNLAGLTRQRNFAAAQATRDLIAYFDDDIVLKEDCLMEMEKVHRAEGSGVAGVGALAENEVQNPSARWKLRRTLGVVPALEPGRYYRSGISIPWSFHRPTGELLEGDWLSGCAMMWKTELVRRLKFNPMFHGYANGEDLEFSLRARSMGRLVVSGTARVLHLQAPMGRPDPYLLGYMTLCNAYLIHKSALPRRTWRDEVLFFYGIAVDLVIRCANLLRPGKGEEAWRSMRGMFRFLREVPGRDVLHEMQSPSESL